MKDIMSRAQKYIQLEEVTRGSMSDLLSGRVKGRSDSLLRKRLRTGGRMVTRSAPSRVLHGTPLEVYGADADFTLIKIPVDRVLSAIHDQSWVRRPRPLLSNPKGLIAGN